jgi:predicted Zn-ribbon and HTH transcriptional regulator
MPSVDDANRCPRCGQGTLQPQGDYVLTEGKSYHAGPVLSSPPSLVVRAAACDECGFVEFYKEAD